MAPFPSILRIRTSGYRPACVPLQGGIRHNQGVAPRMRSVAVLDQVCAQAVELARAAAVAEAGEAGVGPHVRAVAEAERVVTHLFESPAPGYRDWQWSVTLSRASRSRQATVSEVVLVPGESALLAPAWVPWSDRLRAGDLAAGFIATTDAEDPRLTAGWSGEADLTGPIADPPLHPANWEPWLTRTRVPSAEGRRDAASRWYGGEHGPHSTMAKAAPGKCGTCGWLLLIGGPMGQIFGVCSHLLSPSDGRVVSFDHGCGAHSEVQAVGSPIPRVEHLVDDYAPDALDFGHS